MAALAPLAEDRDCVRQRLVGLRVRLGGPDKEPELQDLLHLDALACQHFQKWYAVLVLAPEHLAYDRDQVPHALGLAAP